VRFNQSRDPLSTHEQEMKLLPPTIICLSAVILLLSPAQAEENPTIKNERWAYTHDVTNWKARTRGPAVASELIGMTVKNYEEERLGKVKDLAVDIESGRIVQVIVSYGGIAGIGTTLIAVPPGAFSHDAIQKVVRLNVTKESLKDAPKFEMAKWSEYSTTNHLAATYQHFGEEDAYTFIEGTEFREPKSERNEGGKKDPTETDAQTMIPIARLSQVQKASEIIGAWVKNPEAEKLGTVEDLLLDLSGGRIVAVVISPGRRLGMRDNLRVVPSSALSSNGERNAWTLDTTKEMLVSRPLFDVKQWPDFSQPSYAERTERAYALQFPADQGNSPADIETTAQIRREISATSNISVNAQNVKISSNQGLVTLRGLVETTEEKRIIGEIANRIARSENVVNQLAVKLVPTGRSLDERKIE
jgi:sporulation protein YlmC with PRC-barrel domain